MNIRVIHDEPLMCSYLFIVTDEKSPHCWILCKMDWRTIYSCKLTAEEARLPNLEMALRIAEKFHVARRREVKKYLKENDEYYVDTGEVLPKDYAFKSMTTESRNLEEVIRERLNGSLN